MLKNLASSLILTERDPDFYDDFVGADGRKVNAPAVAGRVVTTIQKAKEVRPLVEKCITIARRSLAHLKAASELETDAERNTDAWKQWRQSDKWQEWNKAIAPAVAARRRCLQLLGDKEAVQILFDEIAPRFEDRDGGYTRIMRLAEKRLGDAGTKAILEFVGVRDRVAQTSEKPSFGDEEAPVEDEAVEEQPAAETEADEEVEDQAAEDTDSGDAEEEEKND